MDFTNLTNVSTMQGVAYYTNNATDGILFTGGIIVFFIIILMYLYKNMENNGYSFVGIFTTSSWIMFVVSGFFYLSKLIPTLLPLMFLILSAIGTIVLYSSSRY
jgi:hypothetical protein